MKAKLHNRYILLLVAFLSTYASASDVLTVAVASNFHRTASAIAVQFTELTGVEVRISAGSTGKLFAQIANGAPYDVYLAADVDRPQRLIAERFAADDALFVYATGRLMLWSTDARFAHKDCRAALADGDYRYLAIANPATAPYGAAARSLLQSKGLWKTAQEKLVLGENIAQTFQFVATGNATLGFVAASQMRSELPFKTTCLQPVAVDESMYAVRQAGVILESSRLPKAARQFRDFLLGEAGQATVSQHGYLIAEVTQQ